MPCQPTAEDTATKTRLKTGVFVLSCSDGDAAGAAALAGRLDAPLLHDAADVPPDALVLRFDADGLTLSGDGMELRDDLSELLGRLKPGRLRNELLVRAAKMKGVQDPVAVDATAGFGEDALLLAAAGFSVLLFERDTVIAALLEDALRRAADVPQLSAIVQRMRLVEGDSIEALSRLDERPDVVYLDPMFPARRKSAAVKKKFQLLHRLERPCQDQEALLQAALAARPRKVIVKRPLKGPCLADVKPSYSLKGKAIRYDVIALA